MIRLEHVNKSFQQGKPAVSDVSFEVNKGETLVLLGTSGSGKTTTLRMINRLLTPDSGQIYLNGQSTSDMLPETLRRNTGYVLQHHGLFPHYTVAENIAIVPALLGWDKQKILQRTTHLMEQLHLSPAEFLHSYPQELSGGQQQRVGLARALAADPPVLLMDEPFGALDPITKASVKREFRELEELQYKTIILVTHDVQEAFELGTRICLMDQGVVQQNGRPEELLFAPANGFVHRFFDDQRLLLELKALRLESIMQWLEGPAIPGQAGTALAPGTSCWDALEHMDAATAPIAINTGKHIIEAGSSELMHALTRYKQTASKYGRTDRLS